MSGRPALRVCVISTSFLIDMRESKKDDPGKIALYARLLCDCFAQSQSGRRSVIPGRSSVHRCPSRFTFRIAAFFAADFFTATGFAS